MACTNEIDHLIARVSEGDLDFTDLDDTEWFIASNVKKNLHVPHNESTLKVLRNLVRILDNSTETA